MAHTFCRSYQGVELHLRRIVARLGTPFAVFAAVAALGIDDGAGVEFVAHKQMGDLVGSFIQCLFIRMVGQLDRLVRCELAPFGQPLDDCFYGDHTRCVYWSV